jgi:hypothetical protein
MKTINLHHKIHVKIENKISKDAFIRQNILNKMNFFFQTLDNLQYQEIYTHIYLVCIFIQLKVFYFRRMWNRNIWSYFTNFKLIIYVL